MTFELTSKGAIALVINSMSITGKDASGFSIVNPPSFPLTLNAGEMITVTVKFMPTEVKKYTDATLNIMSNANGEATVALAGIGIAGASSVDEFTAGSNEFLKVSVGPNPATDNALVSYSVNGLAPQTVALSVVDALGNTVQSFGSKTLAPGSYTQDINASNLPSGSYRLVARSGETAVQVPFVIAR